MCKQLARQKPSLEISIDILIAEGRSLFPLAKGRGDFTPLDQTLGDFKAVRNPAPRINRHRAGGIDEADAINDCPPNLIGSCF